MPNPYFSASSPLASNANVHNFFEDLGIGVNIADQRVELDDRFNGNYLTDKLLVDKNGSNLAAIEEVCNHMLSVAGNQPFYKAEMHQIDDLLRRIPAEKKRVVNSLMKALFFTHPTNLKEVLPKLSVVMAPIFPGFEIHFIKVDRQVQSRFAIIRMLYANEKLPHYVGNTSAFKGFQTLSAVESSSDLGFGEWWNALFTSFSPFSFGVVVEQMGGAYIVCLGELWDTTEFFPQRTVDLFRNDSTHFAESGPTGGSVPPRVPEISFSASQLNSLYRNHLANSNALIRYLLSPKSFCKVSGEIDAFRWYASLLDWNRLITLSVYIQTEFLNNFYKKTFLFQALDILSNLVYINRSLRNLPKITEERLFRSLLDSNGAAAQVVRALGGYSPPFGNYLRNKANRCLRELVLGASQSIFVPGTFENNRVQLGSESLNPSEYAERLVRALRNTHHGYGLRSEPNNKVLAVSTGSIPNSVPEFVTSLVLAAFADPKLFFESTAIT